jgi:trehalose 6-phosphate phosphatase
MKRLVASDKARSMSQGPARAHSDFPVQPGLPVLGETRNYCVFLDFDGTLVEIADRPEDVRVDASTLRFIENLRDATGRALALATGRDIGVIDRLIHPLILPVAGVHGLQRRDAAGRLHSPVIDRTVVDAIAAEAGAAFRLEPGVVIERKTGAVAIHFRLRPDFEQDCRAFALKILHARPDLHLIEIRLSGADKGAIVEAFLEERPFKGRTPIFAGDDATDEPAFAAVNARGGLSVKVGAGATLARFRARDSLDLRHWLETELAGGQHAARGSKPSKWREQTAFAGAARPSLP